MKKQHQQNKNQQTPPDDLFFRNAELIRSSLNEEKREIELSFSSEDPVERYDYFAEEFYNEVLDHSPGSVRLKRINTGGALLLDHDRSNQIGVTVRAWIDEASRKGRAVVRFSKSNRANEIYTDVIDGIRQNVSVGYRLNSKPEKSVANEMTVYRFKDWEPQEISIVSVPADTTVGVGRSQNQPQNKVKIMEPNEELKAMELEKAKEEGKRQAMAEYQKEEKRKKDILELGKVHNLADFARDHIESNTSLDEFRQAILKKLADQPLPQPKSDLGMSKRETEKYNLMDVIRAQLPGSHNTPGVGLVREASAAIAKELKREPSGLFVPNEVQQRNIVPSQKRDLTVGTNTAGGYTVGTDLLGSSFIELLRNKMVVQSLGATVLDGLVGDVAIPRHSAASTAYWISSEAGAITESTQTFEQVSLTPRTVAAYTDMTRKLINQSAIDIQNFVAMDLSKILAIAIDLACFDGTGLSGQPTGISQTSGIGSVTWTATSTPTWAEVVEVESAVAVDNALSGSLAYVANGTMRGVLKAVAKATNAAVFVWEGNEMNGYPAVMSNQVQDDDIFFGNWSDLLIGFWNVLEILVDPFTGSTTGNVRVRAMKDVDLACRHPQSFALGSD